MAPSSKAAAASERFEHSIVEVVLPSALRRLACHPLDRTRSRPAASLRFQPLQLEDGRRVFDDGFGAEVVRLEYIRVVTP